MSRWFRFHPVEFSITAILCWIVVVAFTWVLVLSLVGLLVLVGLLPAKPVEDLAANPLPRDEFGVYDFDNRQRPERAGKLDAIVNHMGNFFDCVHSRKTPISDVVSQHQSATTCHLGNISLRLGRTLKWDADAEYFVNDDEANRMLAREQRSGFEIA